LLLVPVLTFTLSGRQTKVDIDNPEDTFQTRLELWSDSFGEFRSAPIFGIGQGNLTDEIGQVCHNSYLHAYTEMGILGGTVFVGIFYLTLRGLNAASPNDPHLSRLQPYVLALVASYAVGLLSLSRCYTVPTQLILALGSAYLALAGRSGSPVVPRFDAACIRRVFAMGVILLLACYVFLRLMYSPRGVS
jgi:O-antigen ligase